MRFSSGLFMFILLFPFYSCKKSVNENSSRCYFTTKLTSYFTNPPEGTVISQYDSTIFYSGTLTHESDNKIKLDFCPVISPRAPHYFKADGIIYPILGSSGVLTYPDYISTYGYYFSGKIKVNGDVLIEMGANLYGGSFHDSITGHQINN